MRRPRTRSLGAPFRLAGRGVRGIWRGTRGTWRGGVRLGRWLRDPDEQSRRRRHLALSAVVWLAAVASSAIAFGTAGTVYDVERMGVGPTPLIGLLVGLPLVTVLTRPMLGWGISAGSAFALAVVLPIADGDPWPWLVMHGLVLLALLFAVCARERADRALGAWLFTVGLFAWGVPGDVRIGWVVGVCSVALLGWLAGRLARTRRALARQQRVSSQEKAQRVVLQERARIARDLHDIVAHHMSLIVVQAETAQYRVPDLSAPARAELDSIGASARSALAETRTLLNVLRLQEDPTEHAPQPGLEQLPELVDAGRRAGIRIEAELPPDGAGLRPGTSLTAYRIVQEALANAARHAPGATVRLSVQQRDGELEVMVLNGPAPGLPALAAEPPEGHGITGMRERAAAEAGRLTAGATGEGGFAVRAVLPLQASAVVSQP